MQDERRRLRQREDPRERFLVDGARAEVDAPG